MTLICVCVYAWLKFYVIENVIALWKTINVFLRVCVYAWLKSNVIKKMQFHCEKTINYALKSIPEDYRKDLISLSLSLFLSGNYTLTSKIVERAFDL